MRTQFLILFSIQFFLLSCTEKLFETRQVDCYFQYEYVNYAWGFSHSGFTITPSGEIYAFDKTTPWVFAENDKLLLTTLNKNIAASIKIDTLVTKTEIDHYQKLAFYAKSGALSKPVSQGADMGGTICRIIVPDDSDPQNVYREVLLSEYGDFERHNLASEAAVIAEWLKKIHFH